MLDQLQQEEEQEQRQQQQLDPEMREELESRNIYKNTSTFLQSNCILNGNTYRLQQSIFIDRTATRHSRTCARCQCRIPPLMLCIADFQCQNSTNGG